MYQVQIFMGKLQIGKAIFRMSWPYQTICTQKSRLIGSCLALHLHRAISMILTF